MRHQSIGRITSACTSVVVALAILSTSACARKTAPPPTSGSAEPVGYPRGPWWRADVNQTLLGVSHILVSFKGAPRKDQLLSTSGPAPERSHEEALALAKRLRAELAEHPSRFEALAREHSDDRSTAPLGGMVGEVFAPHLPDPVLDALGNLRPGGISRVVETRAGFHIIKRVAVRPEVMLDGSQIVIAHVGSDTRGRAGRQLTRTREQALALAERVRAEAVRDPRGFADLARTHSDSLEGERGGDMGQWSSQARNGETTPLYVLSTLAVGQVSHVLETPQGFRILKRDAHKQRETYAVAPLVIPYASPYSPEAMPRDQARATAQGILAAARQHPEQFDAFREQHCDFDLCKQPAQSFQEAHGMFGASTEAIRSVKVGELVDQVLEMPLGFAVLRREDPATYPIPAPEAVNYELPRPPIPSLETATNGQLLWYVGELRRAVKDEMHLDEKEAAGVAAAFDRLATAYGSVPPNERERITSDTNLEFAHVLGPKKALELTQINARLMRTVGGETLAGR
jgi:hypothetical protein